MKISTILDKIDEKQLFVPAFQREYVWKRDDAKLKREPQAVCCPPPDGDEVSVGTRQRECSDQVIARDFLGKAGQPSQLSL